MQTNFLKSLKHIRQNIVLFSQNFEVNEEILGSISSYWSQEKIKQVLTSSEKIIIEIKKTFN